ncbi:MAG: thiamine diphosphokinase [Selenomonadaceae bacterium]|nr:thiamine diphosphokinase [Selenomonadaceae bacterium]
MYKLTLPNLKVISKKNIFNNEHLLVLGGRTPDINWLKAASENRTLWAVDRGINIITRAGLTPNFLIGDNDSADKSDWDRAIAKGVEFEKYPVEKDYTDLELAVEKLPKDAFGILTGAFGGRFDHTFSNVFSAAHANNNLCLADEAESLFFLKDEDDFEIVFEKTPESISLISISQKCEGVTISGVHWPLKNATLYQKYPNTISNVLEGTNTCNVKLSSGILGVYILHKESILR